LIKQIIALLLLCIISFSAYSQASAEPSPVIIFPDTLTFWNVAEKSSFTKKIHLRQSGETSFSIKSVTTTSDVVSAKIIDHSGKQRTTYSLEVTFHADLSPGAFEEFINIETDLPDNPILKVPVQGNILDGLVLDPPAFGIRLQYPSRKGMGVLKIESTSGEKFEITDISASSQLLKVEAVPMEEGCCGYYIWAYIDDPEFTITRPQNSTLHVKTTSQQGLLVIPVLISIPR
jgi:hypothetical protein